MNFRVALTVLALAALAGCKPAVRGRCNETKDCHDGARCSLEGICIASSGTCAPVCGDGEICSGSSCAALKPVVSVKTPAGPLSPAMSQVTIHVDAAAALALHGLSVEVDSPDKTVASGSLDAPLDGDNLITLGQFEANAVGTVSVRATLKYLVPGATAEEQVSSVAVPGSVDAAPPAVAVFVPAASDAKNGWVPRTSGNLEFRATVDDGSGSGPQAATLGFDSCPAAAACAYPGTVQSQASGSTVFSFQVPRFAQAAGSEAPLAVTVKATDVAGNQAQGAGTLQIDDAPPQIGNFTVVSPVGVDGEDNKTWFQGGVGAPDVEIAVAVSDSGAGLASPALTLHLTDLDVAGPDPTPQPQADGSVHFLLPASRVHGREGAMHFSLTAKDQLGLTAARAVNQINVDAKAPIFTVPQVDYSSATPAGACGQADANGVFACGRQGGSQPSPPHLLRDDTATVTFDGYDCGAGLANSGSQFGLNVTSGGQIRLVNVQQTGKDTGPCGAGNNRAHHFSAQVVLGDAVVALDPPIDANGTVQIALASTGPDRAGNTAQSPLPDGIGLLSLWRWKVKLPNAVAGSPALLPGTAGARTVVVGTTLPGGSGPNLFAIGPDGTPLWSSTLLPDIVGDVAVGQNGTVYASTDASCGATAVCTAVNLIQPPPSGTPPAPPVICMAGNSNFGASPAVINLNGSDLVYAVALAYGAAGNNLFAFTPSSCPAPASATLANPPTDDVTGVTAGAGAAFVSNGHGFTSLDQSGTGFATQVLYDPGNAGFVVRAPPSISSSGTVGGAVFGTAGGDKKVRRAVRQTCGTGTLIPCWEPASGFPQPPLTAPSNLPFTPVFDGTTIWAIDDQGVVFTWSQSTGIAGAFLDLTEVASPPVLVQGGAALVVTTGGLVKLLSVSGAPAAMSAQRLVDFVSAFSGSRVPAPVLDCGRGANCSIGVAYAPGPSGWLWAVQLPAAPVAASTTVWPRPGHDSCNTRNSAESWCP